MTIDFEYKKSKHLQTLTPTRPWSRESYLNIAGRHNHWPSPPRKSPSQAKSSLGRENRRGSSPACGKAPTRSPSMAARPHSSGRTRRREGPHRSRHLLRPPWAAADTAAPSVAANRKGRRKRRKEQARPWAPPWNGHGVAAGMPWHGGERPPAPPPVSDRERKGKWC